jgi:beta-lactamase regulating signal transducer with metallopeptidase domain
LIYHTYFRKLTFFSLNRIYLLSAIVMSFLIPILQINMERSLPYQHIKQKAVSNTDLSLSKIENLTHSATSPDKIDKKQSVTVGQIITTSYWIGVFVSLIIFAIQMASLLKYAFSKKRSVGRLKLISKSKGFTNCSFFHYVFIDEQNLSPEESQAIIAHETIHAAKYHSLDNLLLSACRVLLWFNPLVYLYSKCLAQVHEFQADLGTSKTIGNALYAQLLIRFAIQTDRLTIVHHFNENPYKR